MKRLRFKILVAVAATVIAAMVHMRPMTLSGMGGASPDVIGVVYSDMAGLSRGEGRETETYNFYPGDAGYERLIELFGS